MLIAFSIFLVEFKTFESWRSMMFAYFGTDRLLYNPHKVIKTMGTIT
jgi:hypothetical protein